MLKAHCSITLLKLPKLRRPKTATEFKELRDTDVIVSVVNRFSVSCRLDDKAVIKVVGRVHPLKEITAFPCFDFEMDFGHLLTGVGLIR